ncbi:competence type IV pilus minor pilin ComGG [Bacillus pacificus]
MKKFYIEIEQKFVLEEILNRSITNIKKDLQQKEKGRYFFSFHMKRVKRVEITYLKTTLFSFHCSAKSNKKFSIK